MLTFEVTGPGAKEYADALARGAEALGAPPVEVVARRAGEGDRADPFAVAAFVLSIPPAIVACWDLGERMAKIEALRGWLGRVPAGASVVVADEASGKSTVLAGGGGEGGVDTAEVARAIAVANEAPKEPAWDVFLAYAGSDFAVAEALATALRERGLKTFFDRRSLLAGEAWDFQLVNAQASARGTVVLISPDSANAWYLHEEIQRAVALKRQFDRFLVPVYRDGRPRDAGEVPYGLYRLEPLDLPSCGGVAGAAERIVEIVGGGRS